MNMKTSAIIAVIGITMITMVLVSPMFAGLAEKERGHNLYWKNKIALATDDAIINDSLFSIFLEITESFETDSETGDLLSGSQRRTFSDDHYMGWVLEIVDEIEVKSITGEKRKFYRFEKQLAFDLRTREEK